MPESWLGLVVGLAVFAVVAATAFWFVRRNRPGNKQMSHRTVAFLPWLRLDQPVTVSAVTFVPWRDVDGSVSPDLGGASESFERILAGYVGLDGKAIDNCVVVTRADRSPGWHLDWAADHDDVSHSVAQLFLAAFANNEYFPKFGHGNYVNSTGFETLWQDFTEPVSHVTVVARRRDGRSLDGGYEHGQVIFSVPLQCSLRESISWDSALLQAMRRADAAQSPASLALRSALPYVSLANTDSSGMSAEAEAILMGSAFEQFLEGYGQFDLGQRLTALLGQYGGVRVQEALTTRPSMTISTKGGASAANALSWVHQLWIEELYRLRNASVHKAGDLTAKSWGWSPPEHLLMAAFVFPLIVKIRLSTESHYSLTQSDVAACQSIDRLLAATDWHKGDKTTRIPNWSQIVDQSLEALQREETRRQVLDLLQADTNAQK